LQNEDLYNVYSLPNIIRMMKWWMRWVGDVAHMKEMRNALEILVGNFVGKKPLGRPRHG
jgi:hypothetical protein